MCIRDRVYYFTKVSVGNWNLVPMACPLEKLWELGQCIWHHNLVPSVLFLDHWNTEVVEEDFWSWPPFRENRQRFEHQPFDKWHGKRFLTGLHYKYSFHDRIRATHLRVQKMQLVDQVSWMMTASHAFVRQVLLERYALKVKLCSVTGIFEQHDIISLIDRWICSKKESGCPQLD